MVISLCHLSFSLFLRNIFFISVYKKRWHKIHSLSNLLCAYILAMFACKFNWSNSWSQDDDDDYDDDGDDDNDFTRYKILCLRDILLAILKLNELSIGGKYIYLASKLWSHLFSIYVCQTIIDPQLIDRMLAVFFPLNRSRLRFHFLSRLRIVSVFVNPISLLSSTTTTTTTVSRLRLSFSLSHCLFLSYFEEWKKGKTFLFYFFSNG